jgi:tetratricopeptide (TPR) repeat protein
LLRAGDYAAAGHEYDKVLEQQGDHEDARIGLAVALRGQGKHAQAAQEYERVLAHSPNHAAALFDLAVLRAEFMDDGARARVLFERYLEVAGDGPAREIAERYRAQLAEQPDAKSQPAEAAP